MIEVRRAAASAAADENIDLPESATPDRMRVAGAEAGRSALARAADRTVLAVPGLTGARLAAFVEGLVLGSYAFSLATTRRGTVAATRGGATCVIELAGIPDERSAGEPNPGDAIADGARAGAATNWARDLVNTPASVATPAWLGDQASTMLAALGVDVAVRDVDWLTGAGFGGVLAVGGAAAAAPRLIEASWRPRGAGQGHVVLVGKGITFDTGGLQIKPPDGMKNMKTDMAGGAAVLGALRLVAERRLPVRVTALVPAAENAFGAASYRPGDVIRHVGGRTSEVLNTDAEGRLVLGDAMAYAAARLRPTALVDVATLTGAMKVALGLRTGGLFATDDRLASGLLEAAAAAGEPLWRLPLVEDYVATLDSPVADANNAPGNPGGITAALFLRPFAGPIPWAHLDIAGPARAEKDEGPLAAGGTGFGVRLLAAWIADLAAGAAARHRPAATPTSR